MPPPPPPPPRDLETRRGTRKRTSPPNRDTPLLPSRTIPWVAGVPATTLSLSPAPWLGLPAPLGRPSPCKPTAGTIVSSKMSKGWMPRRLGGTDKRRRRHLFVAVTEVSWRSQDERASPFFFLPLLPLVLPSLPTHPAGVVQAPMDLASALAGM